MAIEGDVQALLATLVSDRCYPTTPPEGTATPYIIYQVIANVPYVSHDGSTGLSKRRMQVDVWASTYTVQKSIEKLVFSTMEGSELSNIPLMAVDMYDQDAKLYRSLMEFSIIGPQ